VGGEGYAGLLQKRPMTATCADVQHLHHKSSKLIKCGILIIILTVQYVAIGAKENSSA